MRVLLVNPPAGSLYHRVGLKFMSLGLGYIAAVLRDHHHTVEIMDFEVNTTNYRKVPYADYDLVGIGSDTMRWPAALKVAAAAKEAGATVVAGGPHVSFMDEDALKTGDIDYVVRSEGEYALLDLVQHLDARADVSDVLGLSYMRDKQVIRNAPRPFVKDLDTMPWPARELFDRRRYGSTLAGRELVSVLTSRGCPFNCEFCSASQFAGAIWRARSVENVLEELEYLQKREGYRAITFFDDNFMLDPDRAAAIAEGMLSRGLDYKFWAFSRADAAVRRPEVVKLMARAGWNQAFIGFESADQETLNAAGKKSTIETSLQAMKVFREAKVKVWGAFMLGFDGETEDMVKRTIKFAKRLNPYIAQFSLVTPYPGTRLWDRVKDRLSTEDWRKFWGGEPTFKLPNIQAGRLKKLFWKAYRAYYMRPRKIFYWFPFYLSTTFRYYTERKGALKRYMGASRIRSSSMDT